MKAKWITCVAVVLALAFPCLGGVLNSQGFGIGNNNGAGILGGGVTTSANVLTAHQVQQNSDKSGLIRTVQAETGALGQVAAIGAIDGYFAIDQDGDVNAFQNQAHNGRGSSLGTQYQGMGVDLDQKVNAALGSHGIALGMQAVVGVQVQVVATPWGVNLNLQPVVANVYDKVGL